MKTAKNLLETIRNRPAVERPEYGAKQTAMVKKLFLSMAANYQGLFLANLDDRKTQEIWERSWMASIAGKNLERAAQALSQCLDTHTKPFTRADFQIAYRALREYPEHRLLRTKRLPKNTWQERKKTAQKHIQQLKATINKGDKK